jgi:hypothetical protein
MTASRVGQLGAALALAWVVLGASLLMTPRAEAAPPQAAAQTVDVTGTFTDLVGGTGTFVGEYTIERFASQGGELVAVGTLTGTATDSLGNITEVATAVTIPITNATGSCEILDLTLGPLDLDLLGLVIQLDQVHLNITAESGPGNLLGNLLCGIAGLLDGNAPANQIARLLNQLLGLLG